MNDLPSQPSRGTPPNREQLAERLGATAPLWDEVRATVMDMGATWKWGYSEATEEWSYRAYLQGERFFVALSPKEGAFEASLNMKREEWEAVVPETDEERARLVPLREKALASTEDPAWVHVPVRTEADLPLLAKILVARARRVQKPRLKPSKKKR